MIGQDHRLARLKAAMDDMGWEAVVASGDATAFGRSRGLAVSR